MKLCTWLTMLFVAHLVVFQLQYASAQKPKRAPVGPLFTIYTPHPERLELALDEIELDWSRQPGAKRRAPARSAVAIAGTWIVQSDAVRALVGVSGATSSAGLLSIADALKAANPGAEAHLVLYEPGIPKTRASRRLLTREVGLLLEEGHEPDVVVAGLPSGKVRPVTTVPGGYVVEAGDPIAALDLADRLRQRPGVRAAYPLLRRYYSLR